MPNNWFGGASDPWGSSTAETARKAAEEAAAARKAAEEAEAAKKAAEAARKEAEEAEAAKKAAEAALRAKAEAARKAAEATRRSPTVQYAPETPEQLREHFRGKRESPSQTYSDKGARYATDGVGLDSQRTSPKPALRSPTTLSKPTTVIQYAAPPKNAQGTLYSADVIGRDPKRTPPRATLRSRTTSPGDPASIVADLRCTEEASQECMCCYPRLFAHGRLAPLHYSTRIGNFIVHLLTDG